jgi:VCBS repeat-containing protein
MANPLTGQLWYLTQGGTTDARISYINADGSDATTLVNGPVNVGTGFPTQISLDAPANFYFEISSGGPGGGSGSKLYEGHIDSAAAPTLEITFGATQLIFGMVVDPINEHIYVGVTNSSGNAATSGILDYTYNPATGAITPVATNGGFLVTKTEALAGDGFPSALFAARDFALDLSSGQHQLYFTNLAIGGGFESNEVYHLDTTDPTFVDFLVPQAQFPTDFSNGYIIDVEVDKSRGLVYFDTESNQPATFPGFNAALNNIWVTSTANVGTTNATKVTLSGAGFNAATFYPGHMTLDQSTHRLYVGSEEGPDTAGTDDLIYVFDLSANGLSATLSYTIHPGLTQNDSNIGGMTFDILPVLAPLTATTTHAAEQGASVTLLTATPTITDADNDHLASATVKITSGTFSSNESSTSDDHLSVAGQISGLVSGTNITVTWTSGTETLLLDGYDTLAHYQSVLAQVQYFTTGDNPTNYGFNNTRTITWQANDGAGGDPTGTDNSKTSSITIDAQNDPPNVFVGGGNSASMALTETNSAFNTSRSLSIADPDSLTETLTLTNFSKTGPVDGLSDATLQGFFSVPPTVSITQATGSASFNWTFNSGSEAFNFLAAGETLTINYTIHDVDSNDSNGPGSASLSDDQPITVTIAGTNDAPTVTGGTTQGLATILEDSAPAGETVSSLLGSHFSDVDDNAALTAAAIVSNGTSASGKWQWSTNGSSWTDVGTASDASAVLVHAASFVRFLPAANFNGSAPALSVRLVDDTQTSFADGATANVSTNGGTTPYSTGTVSLNESVTAVNDAPAGTDATKTILEDGSYTFAAADFGFTDPADANAPSNSGANALLSVIITTLPTAGTLTLSGNPVSASDEITVANIPNLLFTPAPNANGNGYSSFTFQVRDNGGVANSGQDTDQSANTFTFNVTPVNDPPSGANNTVTTNEDTAYTFTTADFGFTDPVDAASASGANSLFAVEITTLPGSGTLTDNNVAVNPGDFIPVADITGGKLKFAPAANANGTGYASFTFQVKDNGGTANSGVDTDPSPNTMTVNVNPVNDPPSGTNTTKSINEDTPYTIAAADFGFSDPVEGNAFAAVKIATITNGSLANNGSAVNSGDTISIADINAGHLVFTPAANVNGAGAASFTFQVKDDGGIANGGVDTDPTPNSFSFNITAVNDAPAGTDKTVTGFENQSYTFAASDFGFTDPNDTPANAFLSVEITTLPATGTLKNNGVAVNAGEFVLVSDINANKLTYTPTANTSGANYTSFTFQVKDDGGTANSGADTDQSPNTLTVNIDPVNVAPDGANKTVTTNEDTPYVFTSADFGFSDIDGNSLSAVKITTLPGSGTLTDNNVAVNTGDFIPVADITGGKLKFAPAANANGSGYASFTFQVKDNGGTANGGVDTDPTPNTMTVDVTAVNDPPSGTNATKSINEDTPYTIAAADFGFSDPLEGNAFAAVKIGTITSGALANNGAAVNTGDSVSIADINAGHLVFTPGSNVNGAGAASFTFQVQDDGGTANGGVDTDPTPNSFTFNIAAVNDGPDLTPNSPTAVSYTENASATQLLATGAVADPDAPANFAGGGVDLQITGGLVSGDAIVLLASSGFTISGGSLKQGANTIGTISGNDTSHVQVTNLTAFATPSVVNSLVEAFGFHSTSEDPGSGDRTVRVTFDDGGNTGGGALTDFVTQTVHVTPVNDPPGLTNVAATADYTENAAAVTLASSILVTDPDPFPFGAAGGNGLLLSATIKIASGFVAGDQLLVFDTSLGIASTSGDYVGINVHYDYDATTHILTLTSPAHPPSFPAPGDTIIDYDHVLENIRFASTSDDPANGGANPTRTITWQIQDAGGTANGGSDLSVIGPSTTTTLTVHPINDAPVAAITPASYGATEQTALNLKNTLSVSDVDGNGGSETVTLSVGEGVLNVTPGGSGATVNNSGTSVVTITGTAAQINALLTIDGTSTVSYIDNTDTPGASTTLTLLIHDNGNTGTGGDLFSSDTATINITAVNDAPVFTNLGEGAHPLFVENGSSVVLDNNVTVSDVELNALGNYGGTILTLQRNGGASPDDTFAGTGSLDLADSNGSGENVSLDSGATFIGTFTQPGDGTFSITFNSSATAAKVASVMHQIVYADASDNPPSSVQIDWSFDDGNTGAQGTGGAGIATGSVTVDITQVDDPPVLINVAPTAAYSPGSPGAVLSPGLGVFDPDATPPSPLTGLASATIKIESGFFAGDELFVNLATSGGHFVTTDGDPTNISVQSNVLGTLILSGNDTVSHYQSVLDAVSYHSTAADPSNGGTDPTRNISWQVNDGALNSQTPNPDPNNLVNETVLHFDVAPTVDLDASGAGTGFTTTFTENGAPIAIVDTDVSIADPDNANIDSATIVLTNAKATDALSIAGALPGGIDSSVDTSVPGRITLHLLNSASLADYQTALGQVRFVNSSDTPDTTDRDITVSVANSADSNVAHATVHVIAVNDPPVLNAAGGSLNYSENQAASAIDPAFVVSDVDSANLTTATVSITGNFHAGEDILGFANQNGITGSYNAATGVLTLSGASSVANYQTALRSVTYFNTSENPSEDVRTISYAADDGSAANHASNVVTSTVTVTRVNDAPVVDAAGGSLNYTENQAASAIDTALTLSDVDSTSLASATVSITGNFHAGEDVLGFANQNGITGSYNAATGVLTLTGAASLANYQAALRSVTYFNTSDNPSNNTRTIGYAVDDGASVNHASNVATATVSVTPVNDPPVLNAAGGSLNYSENQAASAIDPAFVVSDVDSANLTTATVSITGNFHAGEDILGFANQNGITGSYNAATGVLTLSGASSVANYQTALRSVTYFNTSENPSEDVRTISYAADDGSAANHASNVVTSTVTVTRVNDAPVVDAAGGSLNYTENQAASAIDTALTLSDVDSTSLASATVSITGNFHAGEDVLGFANQNGITGSYNAATGVLTLTGAASLANYQAALRSVTYFNTSDNPSNNTRTIGYAVDDGASVNHASNVATATVSVTPVNDPPVLNAAGGSLNYSENQAASAIDPALAVSDVDSANLTTATVSITGNFHAGEDILGFANQNGITGSYNAATGVLTLSGASSVANYQTALRSVTYFNTSENPSEDVRTISYAADDGAAANHASNVVTSTVSVTRVNDAPVVNAAGGSLSYTENQAASAIDTALTLSDVDSTSLASATVSITGNFQAGEDVLGFADQNGITGSYNAATGVLTLVGAASLANYQTALRSVTYFNTSDNPSNNTRTISYAVDDGATVNHASNVATATVSVTPVNEAPVNTVPASPLNASALGNLTVTGLSIADVDAGSGTLSTTLSVAHGTLAVSAAGGATVSGGGTNTVVVTGTLSAINATLMASGNVAYHADTGFQEVDTLTVITNDGGNTGTGGALTDTDKVFINDISQGGIGPGGVPLGTIQGQGLFVYHSPIDLNHDGNGDLLWRHTSGAVAAWLLNGPQKAADQVVSSIGNDWHVTAKDDFNGDGKTDILLRHDDGTVALWTMNGTQKAADQIVSPLGNDWHIAATDDFNGDGKADILLRHDNGTVALWTMNGAQKVADQIVSSLGNDWHIAATDDFNGDGKSDILLRHDNGTIALWTMNGAQKVADQVIGPISNDWHVLATADFNGDGKTDILFRNDNGAVELWTMNGAQKITDQVVSAMGNDWHYLGVGDFNADGRADILWRHDSGTVAVWEMNNGQKIADQVVSPLGNDWHFAGLTDANSDHMTDILWRHDDGTVAVWEMNGTHKQVDQVVSHMGNDWMLT